MNPQNDFALSISGHQLLHLPAHPSHWLPLLIHSQAKMLLKILHESESEAPDKSEKKADGGEASGEVAEGSAVDVTSGEGASTAQSEAEDQTEPRKSHPSKSDTRSSVSDSTCAQVRKPTQFLDT